MAVKPTIREDPSSEKDKIKLTFTAGVPKKGGEASAESAPEPQKSEALPQQLSSQAQQVEAARQLQAIRGKAKVEAEEEQQEDQEQAAQQAQQEIMSPGQLQSSAREDLEKLKQQRAEELKKAKAKFTDHFKLEQKKKEIIKKFKAKSAKKAEKYEKIAKAKIEQMVIDGLLTGLQEVGPVIMQLVAWICLFFADACSVVSWLGDGAVFVVDLLIRGVSQYQRFQQAKNAVTGDSEGGMSDMAKEMFEKFLVQTVLPVGGGAILSAIPLVEEIPWEIIGVAVSGLLIMVDLLKSYQRAKSAENEARQMA